ncbi:SLBB domain-containing protein [Saccharicrinis sp. GN24d3]|uniref:SLBB domain-containing protein n=1 Tax=Saccharicrinis sp. GN24d3 TaxID=3458416 RepID=UPI004035CF84
MREKLFLLAIFILLPLLRDIKAQNVDPSAVNVSTLSTSEIQQLISEMNKRGMSESEAIVLARARGMSESQISLLKQRIAEVKMGGGQANEVYSSDDAMYLNEDVLSAKAELDFTKVDSRIFGFSFFNNENLSFEPSVNSAVSPSYMLGSGDEISIDVWGASQQSYLLMVDRNGNINIPNIGPISIGGLTLENASQKIRSKLVLIYRDLASQTPRTFASINLGQIRSIKVNVIGEVFVPGTYTISGASTVFNALYLAGGPNPSGSFREIKLIRDGKEKAILDVYDYLINGNSNVNINLREGDVILVSPYLNRVVLEGELKRAGIFEAKQDETVGDMVLYAGGFTDDAYTHRLQLYRKTGRDRLFKDVLNKDLGNTKISNGDSIFVGKIIERLQNRVTINGAVYRPGDYELTQGLNLSELIKRADGLREDASMERGIITRVKDDFSLQSIAFNVSDVVNGNSDVAMKREDVIRISSIHDLREYRTVQIYGEIQRPDKYDFKEGMTIEDLIFEAGGFLESASDAYIEVARKLTVDEGSEVTDNMAHVFKMKVPRNLELENTEASFKLQPFDFVFIRELPGYEESAVVKITGEVAYAGEYALSSKTERISDLLERAGGITKDAYTEGAMVTRRVKISEKQKRLRLELLERDSTLEFTDLDFEVVGVSLTEALQYPGSRNDVFLKDGDEIYIPREIQTVKISGEVLNPISSNFIKGKPLKSYIWEGGGFGLSAKRGKVYVVYPNGSASGTKRFFFFRNYPKVTAGSEIVVPAKPYKDPLPASAWIAMASAMASVAVVISNINF